MEVTDQDTQKPYYERRLDDLAKVEFSPGHQSKLDQGADRNEILKDEIGNRIGSIITTTEVMKAKNEPKDLVSYFKREAVKTLVNRFPENRQMILNKVKEFGMFQTETGRLSASPQE